ncbi:MAG: outer membrane beta-barrel protein [Bacteroidota bacterium]
MKNLKLTIGILAVFLMAAFQMNAQQISGKIVDDNNEAIPFANIVLLNLQDSSLVNGATSDINGAFLLAITNEKQYLLKISVMGLEDYFKSISKTEAATEIDLGVIKMQNSTEMLEAVEVKAQRPQFITYADKVVMNVENTSLHDGTTALEAISKSPGVWVNQDGEISVNGKQGARIMIDGRPTYVSGEDLKSMLAGMSAESIKNIEVISNPSAKYDAEGAGGVININFKKNTTRGLSGSIFNNYRYNGTHANISGVNLSGKKNGLGYFVNLDGGSTPFWRDMETRRTVAQNDFELNQIVEDRRDLYKANINMGLNYQLNDAITFGINYRGTGKLRDNNWDTENNISEGENTFEVNAFNDVEVQTHNHTLNGFFNYKISDISKVSIDASYADLNTYQQSLFQNHYFENGVERYEELSSDNESFFNIESIQSDYETDLESINTKFEAGLKYSKVTSNNSLDFYLNNQEGRSFDEERSNQFEYTEQINAAYVDFSKKFDDKTTLKGGLRAEHTIMEGEAAQSANKINRDFINLFPSVFLQHKWTDNYTTNFNYSRRISRPPYIFLNPSIMYTDPYSYLVGNPELRSKFTDGISFTQVFAEQYNLTLGYDRAKDFIGEIPTVDPSNNNTVFFIGNIDQMESYNISVLAPVQIADFWQSNTQMILSHKKFSTVAEGVPQLNQGSTFNMRSTHSFSLPKEFKMELLTAYQSPEVYGLYRMRGYWFADISVKKSFLNDKLDISAAFNDIFRSLRHRGSSLVNQNITRIDQYKYQQGIRLNLRYKFSLGDKFKSNQKQIDLEELQRAGGA